MKIKEFTDLYAWQKGHKLVLDIYKHTKCFPKNEEFILKAQILRAVISITSNISEGFARVSPKEKLYFYNIAKASVSEVRNQLIISKDLNYILAKDYLELEELAISVAKLTSKLMQSIRETN